MNYNNFDESPPTRGKPAWNRNAHAKPAGRYRPTNDNKKKFNDFTSYDPTTSKGYAYPKLTGDGPLAAAY